MAGSAASSAMTRLSEGPKSIAVAQPYACSCTCADVTAGLPGPTIFDDLRDRLGPESSGGDTRGSVHAIDVREPELPRHHQNGRVDIETVAG